MKITVLFCNRMFCLFYQCSIFKFHIGAVHSKLKYELFQDISFMKMIINDRLYYILKKSPQNRLVS